MRLTHRQRLQQQAVQRAEDRRVRREADGQREHGDGRVDRVPAPRARCEHDVLPEGIERREAALVAVPLLGLFHAAESQERLPSGVRRRHTAPDEVVGHDLDVRLQLSRQVVVLLRSREAAERARPQTAEGLHG